MLAISKERDAYGAVQMLDIIVACVFVLVFANIFGFDDL